jgi:hypothetical protein
VLVDVENVGSGGAGGDGQVLFGMLAEPGRDLLLIGGGVAVAVPGGRDFPAGLAGEDRPAAAAAGQGPAEGFVAQGMLRE